MSDLSQEYQQPISNNMYSVTYDNSDLPHHSLVQSFPLSSETSTTLTTIDNDWNDFDSQQFRQTNVTVNLVDCMKCYVKIRRCMIEEQQNHCSNTNTTTELDHQIQTLQGVQEKMSQDQTLSDDDKEETIFYDEEFDREDCDKMKTFNDMYFPWPEGREWPD